MENDLKNMFYEIAKAKGITLRYDTHYDANNYVFEEWEGHKLHRLDFQPLQNERINVTHYIDYFTYFPKLLIGCHNNLPNFPYLAKIEYNTVCDINIHDDPLREKITDIVDKTLSRINAPDFFPPLCFGKKPVISTVRLTVRANVSWKF